jgi:quinol monooxygenase YgiN
MILVDARCTIIPDRREDFIREVKKIIPAVRREAGCNRYELFSDSLVPGIFHFIEEWESRKHLDDHLAQPHMQEYFAITRPYHASPALLTIYEIRSSRSVTTGEEPVQSRQ